MQRDEYLRMLLAGTVTFPATFPQVGQLKLSGESLPVMTGGEAEPFLAVTESPSPKVQLTRRVSLRYVRAVFLPRELKNVDYSQGTWLLADELAAAVKAGLHDSHNVGIAFVCEDAPSLLEVSVGMTAAESIQYYPPLPGDRSYNHYNAWNAESGECDPGVVKMECL